MEKTFLKISLLILITLNINLAKSQNNSDIGLFAGTSYYLGDINTSKQFNSPNYDIGIFYKKNYNARYSAKIIFNYTPISASDNTSKYIYQNIRSHNFSITIYELNLNGEFNFLPYSLGDDKHPFAPYVTAGIGGIYAQNSSKPIQIILPMGVGLKFNIGKKTGVGFEWGFRKTFTDYLDNLSGVDDQTISTGVKQYSYYHDNDWYSILGAFITYKIYGSGGECHAYDY